MNPCPHHTVWLLTAICIVPTRAAAKSPQPRFKLLLRDSRRPETRRSRWLGPNPG
jgi:hypothetical protein